MKKILTFFTMVILWAACSSTFAKVYYVDGAKATNGDGTSWATARNNLSVLLEEILVSPTHTLTDTVKVKYGTYYPTTTNTDPRKASFKATSFLVGGYSGVGETRDPKLYPTILSGDIGVKNNISDNSYHVVEESEHPSCGGPNIDGFIIRDGNANVTGNDCGGGILMSGNCWVENCEIMNNRANSYGGGIYLIGTGNNMDMGAIDSSLIHDNFAGLGGGAFSECKDCKNYGMTFNNDTLKNNSTNGYGGAIALFGDRRTSGLQNMTDINWCLFENNNAKENGGAIYAVAGALYINASRFAQNGTNSNFAVKNGGAVYFEGASLYILKTAFVGNKATNGSGGGIYAISGNSYKWDRNLQYFEPKIEIYTCSFETNTAKINGGAMYCIADSLQPTPDGSSHEYKTIIDSCTFKTNSALSTSSIGGALLINGYSEVKNSKFISNSAAYGGALSDYIFNVGDVIKFNSATITVNTAFYDRELYQMADSKVLNCKFIENSSANGSAIYNRNGMTLNSLFARNYSGRTFHNADNFTNNAYVVNCTFTANTSPTGNAGIYNVKGLIGNNIFWNNTGDELTNCSSPSYSIIENGTTANNNIITDPQLFYYSTNEDYFITLESPAVNAGNDNLFPANPPLYDILGNYRNDIIDIGAYESGTNCLVDFTVSPLSNGKIIAFEKLTFTPVSTCLSQIDLFEWDFGNGKRSNTKYPVMSYTAPGTVTIKMKVYYKNGTSQDVSKTITVECGPPGDPQARFIVDPSSAPFITEKQDNNGNIIWEVLDRCPLGSETVNFLDNSIPYWCTATVNITARQWKLDNVEQSTNTSALLALSTTTANVVSLKVTDANGKTNTITRKVELVKCVPYVDDNAADFVVINNGNEIQGEYFLDIKDSKGTPGNGIKTFQLKGEAPIICECEVKTKEYSWKIRYLNTNYEYQPISGIGPVDFTSDKGFGVYEITFEVKINGKVAAIKTKKLNITFPMPFITCAPYGCKTVANICKEMQDTIDEMPFDKSIVLTNATGTLSLKAIGSGFANKPGTMQDNTIKNFAFWDEGAMRSLTVDGNFTIIARIANFSSLPANVQAGIMVRSSRSSFDKMIFNGTQGGKNLLLHRKKPRQDAYKYAKNDRSDIWFKITRTNGIIETHGSTDGTTWSLQDPVSHELSGFDGSVIIGLAAAGKPSAPYTTVSFENITISTTNSRLSNPNEIINTVFPDGNFIQNWSFENLQKSFNTTGTLPSGSWYTNHNGASSTSPAYEGRYTAKMYKKTAAWNIESIKFPAILTRNGKKIKYLLIDFYMRPDVALSNVAALNWYNDNTYSYSTTLNTENLTANVWNHFRYTVKIPEDQSITHFTFIPVDANVAATTIEFDNVLVAPLCDDQSNMPVTAIAYADGFGNTFQKLLNAGDSDIVQAALLDDQARVERNLPSFVTKNALHFVKTDPVAEMENYYKPVNVGWNVSTLQKNFGKTVYDNSPLSLPVQVLGRKKYMDAKTLYFSDATATEQPHQFISEVQSGFDYNQTTYNINRNYKDAFGRAVKNEATYNDGSDNPKTLITTSNYDILDRVWKKTSPLGQDCEQSSATCKSPSTYRYSTVNKLLETNEADAGKALSLYDKNGNIRMFKDANKILAKTMMVNCYDAFGRINAVYLVKDPDGTRWSQTNADNTLWPENVNGFQQWATLQIKNEYDYVPKSKPDELLDEHFKNTEGKITAQTCYTSQGTIAEYYSYNEKGNMNCVWKKILDLPLHTISYEFNQSGKVIAKTEKGSEPRTGNVYERKEVASYDQLNRLQQILRLKGTDKENLAMYDYWPDNKIKFEYFGNGLTLRNRYYYDFAERLNKKTIEQYTNNSWTLNNTFNQSLLYDMRGNIRSQRSNVNDLTEPYRGVFYKYDQFNRLTNATDYAGNGSNVYVDMQFAAAVEYDDDGSITRFAQGPQATNFTTDGGQYYYYPNSHRLEKITGLIFTNGKDRSGSENFQYDANGNLILDKANKRKVVYDYRNLPSSVTEYSDANMTVVKNYTEYFYDASGNRVLKTQIK